MTRKPRSPSLQRRPFLIPALLTACIAAGTVTPARAAHPASRTAPSFTLPARQGTASLDSLRGRVVLVDFWASWCGPCRRSFPWMAAMARRYGPRGFTVVAIDLDKQRADGLAFLAANEAPFTVAFDPSGKTAESWQVSAMPTSFLVDRSGAIVSSHSGFDPRTTARAESLIARTCAR